MMGGSAGLLIMRSVFLGDVVRLAERLRGLAGGVELDAAGRDVALGLLVALGGADVQDVAVGDLAAEALALGQQARDQVVAEVRGALGGELLQHPRLDDADPDVGQVRRTPRRGTASRQRG